MSDSEDVYDNYEVDEYDQEPTAVSADQEPTETTNSSSSTAPPPTVAADPFGLDGDYEDPPPDELEQDAFTSPRSESELESGEPPLISEQSPSAVVEESGHRSKLSISATPSPSPPPPPFSPPPIPNRTTPLKPKGNPFDQESNAESTSLGSPSSISDEIKPTSEAIVEKESKPLPNSPLAETSIRSKTKQNRKKKKKSGNKKSVVADEPDGDEEIEQPSTTVAAAAVELDEPESKEPETHSSPALATTNPSDEEVVSPSNNPSVSPPVDTIDESVTEQPHDVVELVEEVHHELDEEELEASRQTKARKRELKAQAKLKVEAEEQERAEDAKRESDSRSKKTTHEEDEEPSHENHEEQSPVVVDDLSAELVREEEQAAVEVAAAEEAAAAAETTRLKEVEEVKRVEAARVKAEVARIEEAEAKRRAAELAAAEEAKILAEREAAALLKEQEREERRKREKRERAAAAIALGEIVSPTASDVKDSPEPLPSPIETTTESELPSTPTVADTATPASSSVPSSTTSDSSSQPSFALTSSSTSTSTPTTPPPAVELDPEAQRKALKLARRAARAAAVEHAARVAAESAAKLAASVANDEEVDEEEEERKAAQRRRGRKIKKVEPEPEPEEEEEEEKPKTNKEEEIKDEEVAVTERFESPSKPVESEPPSEPVVEPEPVVFETKPKTKRSKSKPVTSDEDVSAEKPKDEEETKTTVESEPEPIIESKPKAKRSKSKPLPTFDEEEKKEDETTIAVAAVEHQATEEEEEAKPVFKRKKSKKSTEETITLEPYPPPESKDDEDEPPPTFERRRSKKRTDEKSTPAEKEPVTAEEEPTPPIRPQRPSRASLRRAVSTVYEDPILEAEAEKEEEEEKTTASSSTSSRTRRSRHTTPDDDDRETSSARSTEDEPTAASSTPRISRKSSSRRRVTDDEDETSTSESRSTSHTNGLITEITEEEEKQIQQKETPSSERTRSALSLQSPIGTKSSSSSSLPESVHKVRPVASAASSVSPPGPDVAPRPTLHHAITHLKLSQLRLLLSSSPHIFQELDPEDRTVGDLLILSLKENSASHPLFPSVLDFLIKNDANMEFTPYETSSSARATKSRTETELDELVWKDLRNQLWALYLESYQRLSSGEESLTDSIDTTVEELNHAITTQEGMVEDLKKALNATAKEAATLQQSIGLSQIKLERLTAELSDLRREEVEARKEILILQGKTVYKESTASEVEFEKGMLGLHEAELTAQIRAGEIEKLSHEVEKHHAYAVNTKKSLKFLEAERTQIMKQAKFVSSSVTDAETRLTAAQIRAANKAILIQQATEERFKHLQVTLVLQAKQLEKRMLIRKPNPFVRIYRSRTKPIKPITSLPNPAATTASSSSSTTAPAINGTSNHDPDEIQDVWDFIPCAHTPVLRSTIEPTWAPMHFTLYDLLGIDRDASFKIEVWHCSQVDKVLKDGKEHEKLAREDPNYGYVPPPDVESGKGVEQELLGFTTCTLGYIEQQAAGLGVVKLPNLSTLSRDPLPMFQATFSCASPASTLELPLVHPLKKSNKRGALGSIYISSMTIVED